MASSLKDFVKTKDYLLCVDSDGCAMDTMNIKHFECFGPCFADEWQVKDREAALKRWNEINLFQLTRGINRFKGLARILREMFPNDPEVAAFNTWTDSAKELSESAVEAQIKAGGGYVFKKALAWSRATNAAIAALPDDKKRAFDGVYEALKEAGKDFDMAIVSSANYAAVTEEWERCSLLQLVDCVTTQQDGSKAHCISRLIGKGYDPSRVVMVGDAPGDMDAAESNGVQFYPILVNREEESWSRIIPALHGVLSGKKLDLKGKFIANLS